MAARLQVMCVHLVHAQHRRLERGGATDHPHQPGQQWGTGRSNQCKVSLQHNAHLAVEIELNYCACMLWQNLH